MKLEIEDVTTIAREISANNLGHHGSFIKSLCNTWIKADINNQKILFNAMVKVIKKYNLEKEL